MEKGAKGLEGSDHRRMVAKLSIGLLLIFFSLSCLAADLKTGKMIILVKQLRNDTGEVRIALYNSNRGFPTHPELALRTDIEKVQGQEARVVFRDVPYGEYAVSVFHDENANGKLDTNLFGIPKEGLGFSNNQKVTLGAPKYQDCMFKMEENELTVEINIHY